MQGDGEVNPRPYFPITIGIAIAKYPICYPAQHGFMKIGLVSLIRRIKSFDVWMRVIRMMYVILTSATTLIQ